MNKILKLIAVAKKHSFPGKDILLKSKFAMKVNHKINLLCKRHSADNLDDAQLLNHSFNNNLAKEIYQILRTRMKL